jgi:hypothetical protein
MIKAIQQFFQLFSTIFSACDKGARALDNCASYVEESTEYYLDEARIERAAELRVLREKHEKLETIKAA